MDLTTSPTMSDETMDNFPVFTCILSIISLCLNTFLLIVIRNNNIFNEVEAILYQILAVEDILNFIAAVLTAVLHELLFPGNIIKLEVYGTYFQFSFIYQSLGTILLITTSRYLMIVKPFKFSRWITQRRIIIAQVVISICSFFSIGVSILLQVPKPSLNIFSEHVIIILIAPIIAGCIVGTLTCSHILYISIQQSRRINALRNIVARNNPGQHLNVPQERHPLNSFKGIRTVLVITTSYWVAWIPWVFAIMSFAEYISLPQWFLDFSVFMLMCNSCWNLLLYYITNKMFCIAVHKTLGAVKARFFETIQRA